MSRHYSTLTLTIIALLIIIFTCRIFLIQAPASIVAGVIIILVKSSALLFFIPAIIAHQRKMLISLALISLLYFSWASLAVFIPGLEGVLAIIECFFIALLFVMLVLIIRTDDQHLVNR